MNAPARLALASVLAAAAVTPATASGDGLPASEGIDAAPVSAPGGSVEYLTRRAERGRHATLVLARERGSERLLRRLRLPGTFRVPAVAYDGSPSGLSADGHTLVLIRPRSFPRSSTTFAVLDARRLRQRRVVRLRGDFSFDAISPRARLMYLIQYVSRRNPRRYAVRAYDLRARRLLPEPVVDPREPSEPMNGLPITRAGSRDGRWAYTLYDGAEHPFIHALDTERREAVCIDLPGLAHRAGGLLGLRLRVGPAGGSPLTVESGSRVLASVDTRTFRVTGPGRRRQPGRRSAAADEGISWLLAGAGGAAILLAVAGLVGRRRRRAAARLGPPHARLQHGEARRSATRAGSREPAHTRHHDREADVLAAQGARGDRRA